MHLNHTSQISKAQFTESTQDCYVLDGPSYKFKGNGQENMEGETRK